MEQRSFPSHTSHTSPGNQHICSITKPRAPHNNIHICMYTHIGGTHTHTQFQFIMNDCALNLSLSGWFCGVVRAFLQLLHFSFLCAAAPKLTQQKPEHRHHLFYCIYTKTHQVRSSSHTALLGINSSYPADWPDGARGTRFTSDEAERCVT